MSSDIWHIISMKADLTPQRTLYSPPNRDKLNTEILEVFDQQRQARQSKHLLITINQILMLVTEQYDMRILKLKFRILVRF